MRRLCLKLSPDQDNSIFFTASNRARPCRFLRQADEFDGFAAAGCASFAFRFRERRAPMGPSCLKLSFKT
jgi:hypothetical protein